MSTRTIAGMRRILTVLVAVTLASACGRPTAGPGGALDAYSSALGKRDYAAAYKLMSAGFRERHSKEEFIEMMGEHPQEVSDTAARLRSPRKQMTITAEFQYGYGDRLRLVRESGRWRIASNPIEFYSQETPRDALRSFIRAYRLKRWDVMLRFIPNAYRDLMTKEKLEQQFEGDSQDDIDATMQRLEASIDEEIKDNGNEARMRYGDGSEVEFIREDDLWKIRDLD